MKVESITLNPNKREQLATHSHEIEVFDVGTMEDKSKHI